MNSVVKGLSSSQSSQYFSRGESSQTPQKSPLSRIRDNEDFGGVWNGEEWDAERLDWLEALPFTTLFVCGNHENFDELYGYPEERWNGGRVHRVRPHVLHLMRGQVFQLGERSVFTMGGAESVDVRDGILDPEEPDFEDRYWTLFRRRAAFRVRHLSWWEEELPSEAEYAEARRNLERCGRRVDHIITHCAPDSVQDGFGGGRYPRNGLTGFLEEVRGSVSFRRWLFGHYHWDRVLDERFVLLYQRIARLV